VEKKGELPETTKPNIEPIGDNKSDNSTPIKVEKEADKNKEININHHPNKQTVPKWLTILLLIFACSSVGTILNIVIYNSIPFYLLLGFSLVFSIEKWFGYDTRNTKGWVFYIDILISQGQSFFLNCSQISCSVNSKICPSSSVTNFPY